MTDFQLTPIGTSAAWYNPGEPTSGFLLEAEGHRALIDCGSGVIARYLELYGDERPIDSIVLTHVHADHCFDLVPLKYGMSLGSLSHWRPALHLPPGAHERLQQLVGAFGADANFFRDSFDLSDYAPGTSFDVGPIQFDALPVPHYIECFALRAQVRGSSFGYTADTGPSDTLAPFMHGVDVLLAEAALPEDAPGLADPSRGHITASEAGELARAAGAHSLLLTHVPEENGFDDAVRAATAAFSGPVALARSGETVRVAHRLAV